MCFFVPVGVPLLRFLDSGRWLTVQALKSMYVVQKEHKLRWCTFEKCTTEYLRLTTCHIQHFTTIGCCGCANLRTRFYASTAGFFVDYLAASLESVVDDVLTPTIQ